MIFEGSNWLDWTVFRLEIFPYCHKKNACVLNCENCAVFNHMTLCYTASNRWCMFGGNQPIQTKHTYIQTLVVGLVSN